MRSWSRAQMFLTITFKCICNGKCCEGCQCIVVVRSWNMGWFVFHKVNMFLQLVWNLGKHPVVKLQATESWAGPGNEANLRSQLLHVLPQLSDKLWLLINFSTPRPHTHIHTSYTHHTHIHTSYMDMYTFLQTSQHKFWVQTLLLLLSTMLQPRKH